MTLGRFSVRALFAVLRSRARGRASRLKDVARVPLFCLALAAPIAVYAQPGGAARPLACAIETPQGRPAPAQLCQQLGKALNRPVRRVQDARKDTRGDAVQIIRDDVQWTVVLLQNGSVRSWTRVSAADAQGQEATFFARALRVLLRTVPKPAETCVRVVPSQNRSARAPDLVYPWAELKPCVRRSIEVVDPWWK